MAEREPELEVAIVGAGAVGLAVAMEVSVAWPGVAVFERNGAVGTEVSSRSSEVIHAGLYYPPESLKARLCLEGRRLLYELAAKHGIRHAKCGKLIVASTDAEIGELERLLRMGRANGVDGLAIVEGAVARDREPEVTCRAALLSVESGIVDTHGLMSVLAHRARDRGAAIVLGTQVIGLWRLARAWRMEYRDGYGVAAVTCRAVVNAAGLGAQDLMRRSGLDPDAMGLGLHLCKGEYFDVGGGRRHCVRGLVYPPPPVDLVSLGIHATVDLGGGVRLGPNALYVDEIDYSVDVAHAPAFWESIRRFIPSLELADLTPGMAGIRPKLSGPGDPARDFYVAHEGQRGAPGLFNLVGIESPGLTASPAIGRMVASMVGDYLTG